MIPQPGTAAAQPMQPIEPVLTSKWRRVEAMPAREMLVDLGTDEGEGPDDWEDDEVEYLTLEFGNHLPADLLAEHNEVQLLPPPPTVSAFLPASASRPELAGQCLPYLRTTNAVACDLLS